MNITERTNTVGEVETVVRRVEDTLMIMTGGEEVTLLAEELPGLILMLQTFEHEINGASNA